MTMSAKSATAAARHPDRSRRQRHQGHRRRAERAAGRRLRALSEDQELPLAHERPAFPRLPPAARRAGRPDLRDDRPDRRARAQDRRHDAALDRRDRPPAAHRRQRRRLRRLPHDMLAELRDDNQRFARAMREVHDAVRRARRRRHRQPARESGSTRPSGAPGSSTRPAVRATRAGISDSPLPAFAGRG